MQLGRVWQSTEERERELLFFLRSSERRQRLVDDSICRFMVTTRLTRGMSEGKNRRLAGSGQWLDLWLAHPQFCQRSPAVATDPLKLDVVSSACGLETGQSVLDPTSACIPGIVTNDS